MSKKLKLGPLSQHPIVSGLTVALVGWFASMCWQAGRTFWMNILKWIGTQAETFWHHLGTTTPVYMWIVYLCSLILLALLIFAVFVLIHLLKQPNIDDFNRAVIDGILWKWTCYMNTISNPVPYCKDCKMQLVPKSELECGRFVKRLYCEGCNFRGKSYLDDFEQISKVERQIEQKYNNGEWKKIVQSYKD